MDGLQTEHTEVMKSSFKDRVRVASATPLQKFSMLTYNNFAQTEWKSISIAKKRSLKYIVFKFLGLSNSFMVAAINNLFLINWPAQKMYIRDFLMLQVER